MRETLPSDRVQLRSQQELREPGSCALCGSGNCDDGYVDLGVWIEFHGNVYLCMVCMNQAIGTVRALTPEEAQELTAIANRTAEENKELLKEVEELREYRDTITNLLNSGAASIYSNSDLAVSEDSGPSESIPAEPVVRSADGESTPKESTKGSRPVRAKRAQSGNGGKSPEFDL